MTLQEILNLAYYKCDEDPADQDEQMQSVFKAAINQAMNLIAITLDKKVKSASLTYSSKITLPTDYYSFVDATHSTYGRMAKTDFEIIGDTFFPRVSEITTGTFTLLYIPIPTFITTETTDIGVNDMYAVALATYASYSYFLSQKNIEVSSMLLNEFNMILGREVKTNET